MKTCYICGIIPFDGDVDRPKPVTIDFVAGGAVLCAGCHDRIERKGHKGHKIPDGRRVRRAFTDKQADAFVDRLHVRVDCVYDYSAEG